jgi:signal transduction histidine kinase
MTPTGPSLLSVVVRRIVVFSAFAMLAQLVGVYTEYASDDRQLARLAIERETGALAQGLSYSDGQIRFVPTPDLVARYAPGNRAYLALIRQADGAVLFSNCGVECVDYFLPPGLEPPTSWIRQIRPGRPLHVVGGQFIGGDAAVFIEVAILGDRDGVAMEVIAHEVADHMVLPMSLILVVVLGATTLSLRKALKPVHRAAKLASTLSPLAAESRLPTVGMPREVERLTGAVNAAFDRVRDLVASQRIYTSALSHDLRTPLAVAQLELGQIDDPRARKVEADLEGLARLVEQLTTLARLEGSDLADRQSVNPLTIAEVVVSAMAPLVFAAGKTIALIDLGSASFQGYPGLVENALRNLVENAIRHSADSSQIFVEVGRGGRIAVRDRANASVTMTEGKDGAGLGLKIVQRIAEIHHASFQRTTMEDGLIFEIEF